MRRVRNQEVIRRIADRTRKAGRERNIIAVLAIALTTVLFTAVFTVGGSIIEKQQQATMRQVGGTSHAGYKYLTQEEYETVKKDEKLKEVSFRILVGDAVNKELIKLRTEVSYYEDLDAKMSFCYPETGHMPKEEDEIVMSDLTLEALGIPCKIGAKVPLELQINGKTCQETFTLCGYYKGDPIAMSQAAAVSETYANRAAPTPTTSVMDGYIDADDYAGRIMVDFNFAVSLNLEKQVEELTRRCGFPEDAPVGINWAYLGGETGYQLALFLAVISLIILAAGYLIIYNIFYINIYQDIRYYGLLKTIGMTGRQLKKMVYHQAYMYSIYGIPIGLLMGIAAGSVLLPVVMRGYLFAATTDMKITPKPWIFAGAAVFSFVTVLLSCIKPCRIAVKVSPVEAVRYTQEDLVKQGRLSCRGKCFGKSFRETNGREEGQISRGAGRRRRAEKKTKRVTALRLALQNLRRSRKKVVIVIASLSLALVLLNSIYSLIKGFDMDQYVSRLIVSDFSVSDATLDNFSVAWESIVKDGVTEDFLSDLREQEGVEEIGNIYLKEIDPVFSKEQYGLLEERIFDNPRAKETLEWKSGGDESLLKDFRENMYMDGKVYGIGKLVMEKLENPEGALDWEKFRTGKYVIATRYSLIDDTGIDFFLPGEKVTVCNEAGEEREYEVLAAADMPYACGLQHFGMFDCDYILPEEEYLDLMGSQQPMRTLFNVSTEKEEAMEAWMEDYCNSADPNLLYKSKTSIVAQFEGHRNQYVLIGGLLVLLLALIGILNFINTIVTSVLSRRQEFAMMEAVGMTGRQLRRMLCFEGGFYALYTGVCSAIFASIVNVLVVKPFGDEMFFFRWQFTLLPIALCIPVLLAVVLLVPAVCHRSMSQVSVVERMRRAE